MLTLDVLVGVPLHSVSLVIGDDDSIRLRMGAFTGVAGNRVGFRKKAAGICGSLLQFTFLDGLPDESIVTPEFVKQAFGDLLSDEVRSSLSMSTLSHTREYVRENVIGEQ